MIFRTRFILSNGVFSVLTPRRSSNRENVEFVMRSSGVQLELSALSVRDAYYDDSTPLLEKS